jgi:hypothetical protein
LSTSKQFNEREKEEEKNEKVKVNCGQVNIN